MSKLYVCGDSFASLVINQAEGKSWSEIVADRQSLTLEKVARIAASNVAIAMQMDFVLDNVLYDDHVIVLLTDHFRLSVATSPVNNTQHWLTQTAPHDQQRPSDIYQGHSLLTVNITNPKWKQYFEHGYDPLLQHFIDYHVIRSLIARLKNETKNYLIVSGGWGRTLPVPDASAGLFDVPGDNFLNISQATMTAMNSGDKVEYLNHLNDLGHLKLANNILSK